MFSRKKEEKRRPSAGRNLSQFGLLDVPDMNDFDNVGGMEDCDDDDDDLEAELLAITSGSTPVRPKRVRQAPQVNLDAMVAASLRDIPSDEDLSGDDDDPELLDELSGLNEDDDPSSDVAPGAPSSEVYLPIKPTSGGPSLVEILQDRLKMYQEAESNAKTVGESSRARRFNRGIKTLKDQLKAAQAGRVVNEEDIPPPVATSTGRRADPASETEPQETTTPIAPSRPAPPPPVPARPSFGIPLPGLTARTEPSPEPLADPEPSPGPETEPVPRPVVNLQLLEALKMRQDQFKLAALQAKRNGDTDTALKYVRTAKQFVPVMEAVQNGQPVDLSQMPPPPPGFEVTGAQVEDVGTEQESMQRSSAGQDNTETEPGVPEEIPPDDPSLYNAPPPPETILEALEQRLEKYRSTEKAAKEEDNSSKARRMGRIVKQYEGAIKLHKAGKPVPLDDLPTPPGFGPFPQEGNTNPPPPIPVVAHGSPRIPPPTPPKPAPKPVTPAAPTASNENSPSTLQEKPNVRKTPQSRQEKQLSFLLARQKEFKDAALQAKHNGEVNQAKEYLRLAKGFDPLIQASNCGLPVDMATVPVPPDSKVILESDFDFIMLDDCLPGSDAEIFEKLEEDLLKQAKMCLTTRDHFKAIGDVASTNRFEQLALHSKKDLDAVRCAHRRSEPIPKFHYETKTFSIVQCCTDLGDNDLELTIVQGINYTVTNPKEVDTYVRFEFPYPSDDPPKDRTGIIRDTNNPEYNQVFPLTIHRSLRACQRVFKRQAIKLEVWSRGSFFRSDALIGTVMVKLSPLETKCVLHDAFDLLDGRKPVGGKIEVKVRIRNPIQIKQVEQVQEKWLIIDSL